MSQKFKSFCLLIGVGLLFTGCGGSSDAGTTMSQNSTIGVGYYIDSAVGGINYVCGEQNGTTGIDGSFQFEKGKDCTFKIGEIVLRSISAKDLIDKGDIFEDNVSVAQMLQTLDTDGNATNGIIITSDVIDVIKSTGISLPTNESDVIALHEAVKNIPGYTGKAKSLQETQSHLNETKAQRFKSMIAGKTLYSVSAEYGRKLGYFSKWVFNADATSVHRFDNSDNSYSDAGSYQFSIEGPTIVFGYIIFADRYMLREKTEDYFITSFIRSGDIMMGDVRFYTDESKAKEFSQVYMQ
ncbi:MAG: hypothetical protein PHW18_01450 [Sulfuricurvum sp.]|uniref:hypothetical protein n=1 Tax=Sulfuricurvum sp. TaxID=2025608 RepID=UPI0026178CEA|nr:hypothetical protein [Sulfuricurvum sp.]MDD2828220.1 hypothetical protein [Sulfuricurvum sp.]MDD4949825.1 hypothetical protein [Sulfuricurvum sp.]